MTVTTTASAVGDPAGLGGLRPGTTLFGRYELLEQVGGGATGPVWRARDALLRRDVALKHLRTSTDRDPAAARARTHHDGRAAARVHHPSIAALFDMADLDGDVALVVEFLHGTTLAQVLATAGPLPPAQVVRIGTPLAEGLAAAHARGVVHGDLKPADVVLGPEGSAAVAGFGIADLDSPAAAAAPRLRAPERAHGAPPTPAGDVWALGATLHTAVVGRPPGGPAEPDPRPLGALLAAMVAPDPLARPDAAQVHDALTAMAEQDFAVPVATTETHTPAGGTPIPTPTGAAHPSTRTFGPGDLPDPGPRPAERAETPASVPLGAGPLAPRRGPRRAPRRRAFVGAGVVGTAGLLTAGALGALFTTSTTPTADTGAIAPPSGAVAALPPIVPAEPPAPPDPEPSRAVAAVPMSVEIDDSDDDRSQRRAAKHRDDRTKDDDKSDRGSDDDGDRKKKHDSDRDDDGKKKKKDKSDRGDSGEDKDRSGSDDGGDDD